VANVSATATGGHEDQIGTRPLRLPARLLRLVSDDRLVELLRGGSDAAFEVLYRRHHRGVLAFSRHMLGSVDEAEDAVQHTFLAAYADLLGSDKPIQLRPWLYAIARNRCLSVLRARRERAGELVEPETANLAADVERRWELRALLGDLAGLPDDQRAALVLAELGDLSHDEIGAALGCPREKVKALVFQARSSLIASREARETSCDVIREQLANLRGSALRRNILRRHVRECAGCSEFFDQVRAQRRDLALVLPVVPSLGLQTAVLGGGAAVTGSVVAKTAIVLALVGGGAAAAETVREDASAPVAAPKRAVPAVVKSEAAGVEPAVALATRPSKAVEALPPTARGHAKAPTAKRRPAGQAKKPAGFAPPGQTRRSGGPPPGHAKRTGEFVPPGRSTDFVPPGQAKPFAEPPGQAKPPAEPAVAPEKVVPRVVPKAVEKVAPPAKDAAPGQVKKP
jgi:RNA polymerase sigma factor (sigma-70 family)